MQLVERHIVESNHPFFAVIDGVSFAAKNLYNAANYIVRQRFIHENRRTDLSYLYHEIKPSDAYRGLPRKVSNDVLRQVMHDWAAYRAAKKAYDKDPSSFLGCPKLPKYKDKQKGRNLVVYDKQAIGRVHLRAGLVVPSGLDIAIPTKQVTVDCLRIVPKKTHYVLEVVYPVEPKPADLDRALVAGVDLGIDNLMAVASNKPGFTPVVVNGQPLKSINQFYNKRKAELHSFLDKDRYQSSRIERLTDRRNRKADHYLHNASRRIIDLLVANRIGVLVIGKNDGWKQQINIGKRNNQNFVQLPHARLISMLKYKAELVGIVVHTPEESYTSKTSFLDGELPHEHQVYAGRRVQRGLFKSANGTLINADVNGAYQVIKKVFPAAFAQGIEGVAVRPLRLSFVA